MCIEFLLIPNGIMLGVAYNDLDEVEFQEEGFKNSFEVFLGFFIICFYIK